MPHLTALFALNLMHCQMRLQISRVKNIGNVFKLSGVEFRLVPPYGGILVFLPFGATGTSGRHPTVRRHQTGILHSSFS